MTFSSLKVLTALAIVNVFETSKPLGDAKSVAVNDDGAGISYGINQFTHRSGSLLHVVERYLASGSMVGRRVIESRLPQLRSRSRSAIEDLAADTIFIKALQAAGATGEMRVAQISAAVDLYLRPAIGACEAAGFVHPLSLAVVFDSMNHGSWEKIRSRVRVRAGEKQWITEYVRLRHKWLESVPRLRATAYRTRFFLEQIALGKWDLELPLNVRGARLTAEIFDGQTDPHAGALAGEQKDSAVEPDNPTNEAPPAPSSQLHLQPSSSSSEKAQPPDITSRSGDDWLSSAESQIYKAAREYDRAEAMVTAVVRRKDSAKLLWAAVAGSLWQTAWAIFGFASGLPRTVWLAAAAAVAAVTLLYLYRQIALGAIREKKNF